MATAAFLPFVLDPQSHHHGRHCRRLCPASLRKSLRPPLLVSNHPYPQPNTPKSCRNSKLIFPFSTSQSSSTSSSTTLRDSLHTGRFLTNEELEKLQFLKNFQCHRELESGSIWVRAMREDEADIAAGLLAESFAESMLLPVGYVKLLAYLVEQYLNERRTLMPHTVTLLGFYRGDDEEIVQLAGTVEVCFDKRGVNASPPTPTAPKNSPYICNMAVKKSLRRRGIGWHLLKVSEELISEMSTSATEVYLHCRLIDSAPFDMYIKAGYEVVKTDSFLILLTLQRRKHLMCKQLPASKHESEEVSSWSDS